MGQLAADLLIATLGLEPAGTVLSPTALPVAGLGATGGGGGSANSDGEGFLERLSTELELFSLPSSSSSSSSDSFLLLQQRASDAPGASRAAAKALGAWAKSCGIERILVLASVDAADRRDAALSSSPFSGPKTLAFVSAGGGALGGMIARAEACGVSPLPSDDDEGGEGKTSSSHETGLPHRSERRLPPWPLLAVSKDDSAAPATLALLSYATEGDNAADAVSLAAAAASVLGVKVSEESSSSSKTAAVVPQKGTISIAGPWRAPAAWAAAYGGRAVPVEM